MDNIFHLIENKEKPTTTDDDILFFNEIYHQYSIDEWLNTNKVFEIGNFIAYKRPDLVSLGIRLNVQVNLFLRTIRLYSSNYKEIFNKIGYDLGCFALTETKAGVLSGLIIDSSFKMIDNNLIVECADKQWISQGINAKYALVFVSDTQNKSNVKMCLVDMNDENIYKERMKLNFVKTLDLGKLSFKNVVVSKDNVLDLTENKSKMEILNGLLYGRYMITTAVVHSILGLINHIENSIKNEEKFKHLGYYDYLLSLKKEVENYISILLSNQDSILKSKNVFLVNCYKVYVVETSIKIFNKLNLMFGIRATLHNLTYETLILNKVAEGDTSVLRFAIINDHYKKGFYNIITNQGFSYYEILSFTLSSKAATKNYIMNNFESISDKIIASKIPTIKIRI